ncbi:TAP-like protein-domain-containing protein [Chytriomyces sp. MP71]|nr:TAP-like protein-domain-containing protein [Chytriomyces sp. MP71]
MKSGATLPVAARGPRPTRTGNGNAATIAVLALCASVWLLAPSSGARHSALADEAATDAHDPFRWKDCDNALNVDPKLYRCGKIHLPLDHLDFLASNTSLHEYVSKKETIGIAVIKRVANKKLKKGTVFVNPGGPGGSGVQTVTFAGEAIFALTGGVYDILGFDIIDPRGIMDSRSVHCFESPVLHRAFNVILNEAFVPNALGSATSVQKYAQISELFAASCGKWSKDILPYISTAYTARDIDAMRNALGEDVYNYWGFSYGTFLGITLVNMFPDRVGRVLIDGVTDPTTFAGNYLEWSVGSLLDVSNVVDGFSRLCYEAGPQECALAKPGDNSDSVKERLFSYFESLAQSPVVMVNAHFPRVFEAKEATSALFEATYSTGTWKSIATSFARAIFDNDPLDLADSNIPKVDESIACPLKDYSSNFGFPSVKCNDGFGDKENTLEEWEKAALATASIGPYFGESWAWMGLPCKYWPSEAVERFAGPWNYTLKNQVLLIGNTYDPVTPLASAKLAEGLMEGNGILLTHDAYGHCSLSQRGACTLESINAFFKDGVYPEPGTVCKLTESERNPFLAGMETLTIKVAENAGVNALSFAKQLDKLQEHLSSVNIHRF